MMIPAQANFNVVQMFVEAGETVQVEEWLVIAWEIAEGGKVIPITADQTVNDDWRSGGGPGYYLVLEHPGRQVVDPYGNSHLTRESCILELQAKAELRRQALEMAEAGSENGLARREAEGHA